MIGLNRRATGLRWVAMAVGLASLIGWAGAQTAPAKPVRKPATTSAPKPAAATGTPAPSVVTRPGFSYTVAAIPAWVDLVPPAAGAPSEGAPMHYRVIDDQVRVGAGTVTDFSRTVRVVNQAAGLTTASQIELEFDPSYQKLVLHRLDLVREGQRNNRIDRSRIELLQREKQLEQRMYDGRVTVSIVIDDVRVGDEIEFAYSLEGANPVFDGKYVGIEWFGSFRAPTLLRQFRLLAPEGRPIRHTKGPADATMEERIVGGVRETVFRRRDTRQLRPEPGTPMWAMLAEQLQFSEFADWAEVAAWGDALFRGAAAGPRTLAKAQELSAAPGGSGERVQAALRFVQQDVRYFGVEIGTGTHKPHAPDQVMEQRFGDCKDKVALLVALLKQWDVPARPVLVSTRMRDRVDRMLPSPLAFDHVIARVDLDGKPLWLDPTRAHQTGPLPARQSVGLGKGLEVAAATTALVQLPQPFDTERMRVEDRFRVLSFTEDVVLESRIVYRGDLAESMREAIATQGLPALQDALGSYYLKAYPKLRRLEPAVAEDVPDDDALSIRQRFAVPEFWRFPDERVLVGEVMQWAPVDLMVPQRSETRREPLAFAYPGVVRHQVKLEFPADVFSRPGSSRDEAGDAHFTLATRMESTRNQAEFNVEARVGVDQVEPAAWPAYIASLNKAVPKLAGAVAVPAVPLERMEGLTAQARRLDEDMRRGRVKVLTKTQIESQYKLLTLGAQIEGGRLPPPLKAQALIARGVALDQVGKLEEARADFEAALALQPESDEALNGAAVNAQIRGDHARAVELATKVLAQRPRDGRALNTRALAHYMAGRVPEATADWEQALADRATLQRGYALLWLALATKRAGQPVTSLGEKYPRSSWPTEWPRPLLDAVFGTADADAVMKQAKASKTVLETQTEAYFYLGERYAAEGDNTKARDQWKRAVDLGVVEFLEYQAAAQRLAASR